MDSPRGRERVKTCQRCGKEYQGGGYKFCSKGCMLGTGFCKRCGREFQRGFVGQRFCKECHGKSELKVCQGCGGTFRQTTPGQVYCSKGCYERSRARTPEACPQCGKEVPKGRKYCSDECWFRANGTIRVCQQCGKEFHKASNGRVPKYCSNECAHEAQVKRPTAVCKACGKEYRVSRNAKGDYCSRECQWASMRAETSKCTVCGGFAPSGKAYCSERCKAYAWDKKRGDSLGFEKVFEDTLEWMERLSKTAPRACDLCGGEYLPAAVNQVHCGRCAKYLRDNNGDLRIYRNGKPDLSITLRKLYERDRGYCRGCGRHIEFVDDYNSDDYPSIDHILPISKGGTHTWDNVQLMCRGCNSLKCDEVVAVPSRMFQTRLSV